MKLPFELILLSPLQHHRTTGLSSEEKLHGVKYIIESFVGCIRNVVLSSGKAASDLLPITPLIATKHENVHEGCLNKCHHRENLCFIGSKCINHYHEITCDCFGTKYEGEQCDIYSKCNNDYLCKDYCHSQATHEPKDREGVALSCFITFQCSRPSFIFCSTSTAATILTLRGSSFVSYRIYDWKDRVHSSATRISLMFKTRYDDSALFYASGESLKQQYIAASIKNNSVYIEMDFGDGAIMTSTLGTDLTSHYWHNLTILHRGNEVLLILDDQMKILDTPNGISNLLFDPEIYFGGGPDLNKKKGLSSNNNFAGSFKYVFYNDVSILYELKKGNTKVHYIGGLEAEFEDSDVEVIPITFPFATSHIWWPRKSHWGWFF